MKLNVIVPLYLVWSHDIDPAHCLTADLKKCMWRLIKVQIFSKYCSKLQVKCCPAYSLRLIKAGQWYWIHFNVFQILHLWLHYIQDILNNTNMLQMFAEYHQVTSPTQWKNNPLIEKLKVNVSLSSSFTASISLKLPDTLKKYWL